MLVNMGPSIIFGNKYFLFLYNIYFLILKCMSSLYFISTYYSLYFYKSYIGIARVFALVHVALNMSEQCIPP